jgi:hypothetical protein
VIGSDRGDSGGPSQKDHEKPLAAVGADFL